MPQNSHSAGPKHGVAAYINKGYHDNSGGGGSVDEAPEDGNAYLRSDAGWSSGGTFTSKITISGGGAEIHGGFSCSDFAWFGSQISCGELDTPTLGGNPVLLNDPTAPMGVASKQYVDSKAGGISEAPNDGNAYGRDNSAWVEIPKMNGSAYFDGANINTLAINQFVNVPQINPGGGVLQITGQPTLQNDPTAPLGIATKQYVDALQTLITALTTRVAALEAAT